MLEVHEMDDDFGNSALQLVQSEVEDMQAAEEGDPWGRRPSSDRPRSQLGERVGN